MTTDLKSMTVEELCEKALYTRLAAYEIARRLEEAQQKIVAQYDKMVEQQIHIFELMNRLADAGHPYATALPELAAHGAELTAKAKAEALEEFMLQFGDEDCPPRLVDDALAKAAEYRAKAGRKE